MSLRPVQHARTDRLLSIGAATELPGEHTILDRLTNHRSQYCRALESADAAWARGTLDVAEMANLLRNLLLAQIQDE